MSLRLDNRWSTVMLALVSTVATLSVAGTAAEFGLRYRERHRPTVPGTMPLVYYRHDRLGYALVRNADYFGWVHVNREGFRGPDVLPDKSPGVVRIMVVGSSTTFDSFVTRDSAAWPARLQFWLKDLAPNHQFEVINVGVPGYVVIDHLIRLETDLYRYHPDVIILYETHNDLFGGLRRSNEGPPLQTNTPDEIRPVTPWMYWLGRHSLLYTKLVERWNVMRFARLKPRGAAAGVAAAGPAESDIAAAARQFERDVTDFVVVARALGIRVVLLEVVHVSGVGTLQESDSTVRATWRHAVPFARSDIVLEGYDRYGTVLRSVADNLSLRFIPTGPFGLKGTSYYAEDDPIHFNDRGADRMGQEVARALLAVHVLDLQPTAESGRRSQRPVR